VCEPGGPTSRGYFGTTRRTWHRPLLASTDGRTRRAPAVPGPFVIVPRLGGYGVVMSLSRTETVMVSQWLGSPEATVLVLVKVAFHEMVLTVV
jgi:hypothetical protein